MTFVLMLALLAGDDKAATEALEKFKTDYKAKETAAKVKAIEDLAQVQHEKITAKLASLLSADEKQLRVASAKGLGDRTDDKEKKKAGAALGAAVKPNEKMPDVLASILEAIAKLKDEGAMPEVHKLLESEVTEVAQGAVTTAGAVKSKTSFDPLIKRLKEADEVLKPRDQQPGVGGGKGGFGGGFGGGRLGGGAGGSGTLTPKEKRDLAKTMQTAIKKVLSDLAGTNCEDGKDWESWWKEHQNTWKAPK